MYGLCLGFIKRDMLLRAGGTLREFLLILGLAVVFAIGALSQKEVMYKLQSKLTCKAMLRF